jgi:hypothetical protein
MKGASEDRRKRKQVGRNKRSKCGERTKKEQKVRKKETRNYNSLMMLT